MSVAIYYLCPLFLTLECVVVVGSLGSRSSIAIQHRWDHYRSNRSFLVVWRMWLTLVWLSLSPELESGIFFLLCLAPLGPMT